MSAGLSLFNSLRIRSFIGFSGIEHVENKVRFFSWERRVSSTTDQQIMKCRVEEIPAPA